MAETVASRTTDDGETLVLKRRPTNRKEGAQHEYYVTERGSNERVDRYEFTRKDGMRQLRNAVKNYERSKEAERRDRGPSIPGVGGGFGRNNSNESNGPQMPFVAGGDDDTDNSPVPPTDMFGGESSSHPGFGMGGDGSSDAGQDRPMPGFGLGGREEKDDDDDEEPLFSGLI